MRTFAPLERVATSRVAGLGRRRPQFLDLAGDGQLDLVELDGPTPGLLRARRRRAAGQPFRAFASLPQLDMDDPNLRFVDLDGDGHADV